MTSAEERFREKYPKAYVRRMKRNVGGSYYLVYKTFSDTSYAGAGDTKAAAWVDACRKCDVPPKKRGGK